MAKVKKRKISERELFGIPSRKEMERASVADIFNRVRSETALSFFGQFAYELTDNDRVILKYLAGHPEATQVMMAKATGIPLGKVKSSTATLRTWGYLARIGTTRQGSWQVLTDIDSL